MAVLPSGFPAAVPALAIDASSKWGPEGFRSSWGLPNPPPPPPADGLEWSTTVDRGFSYRRRTGEHFEAISDELGHTSSGCDNSNAAMLALFFSLVTVLSFGLDLWLQIDSFLEINPSWVFVITIVMPLFCICLHILIFYSVG